jgi:hypothetical protein
LTFLSGAVVAVAMREGAEGRVRTDSFIHKY